LKISNFSHTSENFVAGQNFTLYRLLRTFLLVCLFDGFILLFCFHFMSCNWHTFNLMIIFLMHSLLRSPSKLPTLVALLMISNISFLLSLNVSTFLLKFPTCSYISCNAYFFFIRDLNILSIGFLLSFFLFYCRQILNMSPRITFNS
jgi:hypothetical protein